MVNGIDGDQNCLLLTECLLDDLAQTSRISLNQQAILVPTKRRIGEQDINLIRQDETSGRTILALRGSYSATAEGVAQLVAQLFHQATVNRIGQVRNESSVRTFSNSGNELLLASAKCLDTLQGFFPTDLLALGPFNSDFRLQGFHRDPPSALCRKRKQIYKPKTTTKKRGGPQGPIYRFLILLSGLKIP